MRTRRGQRKTRWPIFVGSAHAMTLEDRFWSKVDKNGPAPAHRPDLGPCQLWTAGVGWKGYGRFWLDGRARFAHRIAYEMNVGPIPTGFELDHLCRVRHCVNDSHLEPVAHVKNIRRGESLPALNARKTHCPRGHAYSGKNLYMSPNSRKRYCRICCAEEQRRRSRKKRVAP